MKEHSLSIFEETHRDLARQLEEAFLDHEALERPLAICELQKCRATCCHDGVVLTTEEAEGLRKLGGGEGLEVLPSGKVKTRTREANRDELAEGFPSHFQKTRCVFLDDQFRCRWQLLAVAEGRHPWFYKPTSCWLHPLLIKRQGGCRVITIRAEDDDPENFATQTPCGKFKSEGPPAWQSLAMELKMLGDISGRDFYGQMNAEPGFSAAAKDCNSG